MKRKKKPFFRQWDEIPAIEQAKLRYRWNWLRGYKEGAFLITRRLPFDAKTNLGVFPKQQSIYSGNIVRVAVARPPIVVHTPIILFSESPAERLAKLRKNLVGKAELIPNLDPLEATPMRVDRRVWSFHRMFKDRVTGLVVAAQPLLCEIPSAQAWQAAILLNGKVTIKTIIRFVDCFGVPRLVVDRRLSQAERTAQQMIAVLMGMRFRGFSAPPAWQSAEQMRFYAAAR